MDRVLAWKPNDPGLLAASSASHSLCGWGQTLESCRESHHFAVSKRHVAARTALGLRAVLALGIAAALRGQHWIPEGKPGKREQGKLAQALV